MQNIRLHKSWYKYVPWVAIVSLIIITIGVILWAVGSNRAFNNTTTVLTVLNIQVGSSMVNTIKQAGTGAVVVCILMAVLMVGMALGRTSLEKKIDEQGRAVCGTWLWLAITSILAAIWWFILFWMVFVIFGSCLWYAAAYIAEGALGFTLEAGRQLQSSLASATNATGAAGAGAGAPTGNSTLSCPTNCFNSAYFSYYTRVQDQCICDPSALNTAWAAADSAARNLHLTVAGSFVMWVGTSFLLLVAVSNFASTKRERELLLRAQRNAAQAASTNLAVGGGMMQQQHDGYKDTQPLLMQQQQQPQQVMQPHPQAHSVIQMQPPGMQGMPPGRPM